MLNLSIDRPFSSKSLRHSSFNRSFFQSIELRYGIMNHCKICQHKQLRVIEIPKKGIIYYSCPNCLYIAIDDEFVLSETDEKQRYDLHENSSNNSPPNTCLAGYVCETMFCILPPIRTI